MEQEINTQLKTLEEKIDNMYRSVEKIRKYFLISTIITVVMFVLPLIALIVVIPMVLSMYSGMYEGLL